MSQRNFVLGDEWVYLKYYGGPVFLENFLLDQIAPCIERLLKDELIDKWFFIRYFEGGYHLRIRLHLKSNDLAGRVLEILAKLSRASLEENLIWKIQGDTYKREIERYGIQTIDVAENFFYVDSEMTTTILRNLKQNADDGNLRWLYAIYFLNLNLGLFKREQYDKVQFLENMRNSFLSGLSTDKSVKKQLSNKFRLNRRKIEEFLKNPESFDPDIRNLKVVEKYTAEMMGLKEKLDTLMESGHTSDEYGKFQASLIHMTMNRLFRTKANLNEVVCYDLLAQLTKSELARMKNKIK